MLDRRGSATTRGCREPGLLRPSSPVPDDHHSSNPLGFSSIDLSGQDLDFTTVADSNTPTSAKKLAAEMKRLELELKQSKDMYSTSCKEAISAKQKAKELHQWRMEEIRRFEKVRLSEKAAVAMSVMEKARCKAAIEAAGTAQKLAEKEAQRRRYTEHNASREAEAKTRASTALAHSDVPSRKYTIEEIEAATEKFSQTVKIGESGYGPVNRGKLDHTPIAIKFLRTNAVQGRDETVPAGGACPEYGCLVYEYMSYGSLEDRLLRRGDTPSIPWRPRFNIAADIATALLFFHQAKPEPLVHRDLKPANILLDRNYVSKISDVGLVQLVLPSVADSDSIPHDCSCRHILLR